MTDRCAIYGRVCVQLTVERHPEEEPVGNVHHDGPQQIESVHVSRGVRHVHQTVQVFGRGRHTNPHRPLEAGTRQSCNGWVCSLLDVMITIKKKRVKNIQENMSKVVGPGQLDHGGTNSPSHL